MGTNGFPRKLSLRDRFRIHDGLSGGLLECGCACGRYLTYAGTVLTVIDDASACRDGHARGLVMHETLAGEPPPPLPFQPDPAPRDT